METKLAQIVMESVIKMTSLTDANIFILIESGNKRFFGGKRHLCETFTKIGLLPDESDVHLEANLDLSCLTPKREEFSFEASMKALPPNRKRASSSQAPNTSALTKRWSSETIAERIMAQPISGQTLGRLLDKTGEISEAPTSKRKARKRKKPIKKKTSLTLKKEVSDDSSDLSEIKCELIDDSFVNDKLVTKNDSDDDDDDSPVEKPALNDDNDGDSDDGGSDDASDEGKGKELLSMEDHLHDEGCEQGWCPLDTPETDVQLMREWLVDDQEMLKKLDVVLSITEKDKNKLVPFDSVLKTSILSVCYALGSHFAVEYYPANDRFSSKPHKALFMRVWSMFPNLHPFAEMLVERNSGKESGFLRTRCQDSFLGPFRKRHYRLMRNFGVVNKSM